MLRRLRSEDDGQLLLLVLCYTVIAGLLITVVVNVSKAYLYRRSLVAAADAAALSGANQPDLDAIYGSSPPSANHLLPLDDEAVTRAVRDYVRKADLRDRLHRFEVVSVATTGSDVTVTMSASVPMPFLNLLSSTYRNGYPLDATATARAPVTP